MTSGSILGTRVVRTEDPKLLTSGGDWISNVCPPNAVHLAYVRSPIAHAVITSVDTTAAAKAPGVVAVYSGADLGLDPLPAMMPIFDAAMVRPWLATDRVRYVGEPVVVVAAETKAQAVDATELVVVEYEPLVPVLDVEASARGDVLLFDGTDSNVTYAIPGPADPSIFDGCDTVVEMVIENQRIAPAPLEVRSSAAAWEGERLTYWACGQGAHGSRDGLARALGLDPQNVRAITPDVGGGFGAKNGNTPEEMLAAWVARALGRPALWTETRSENMVGMGHGRGQRHTVRIGGTRDGRVLAYRLEVLQDAGAYPGLGAMLPRMTRTMTSGVYDIARVEYESRSVMTTTTPMTAFRGAGRPEAAAAIERAIDRFSAEIGRDPAEVRRRNFLPPDRFPLQTPTGGKYDSGEYAAALEKALEAAGYVSLREEQARRRAAGDARLLGIGLSTYVEITNPMGGGEYGSVEITADGGAIARTGSSAHGQGHRTVWAMLVHDQTGIPIDRIEVRYGDTSEVPRGTGTGGSKSLQAGGTAVHVATAAVVEKAREQAAALLEAAVEDVVIDRSRGVFHVAGSPTRAVDWATVAGAADGSRVFEEVDLAPMGATFPFGAHVSVVEVDAETGRVTVLRHVACDDAGRIINPLIFDGQVHGGIASGIAQALIEEIRFDPDGNPITANFADYGIISAAELPSFERVAQETPTPLNPLGAKGIGEAGTIGATPAVQNAVVDALSHLGVRHIDMPCTSEKVWRAIRSAGGC